jgi:hypothetical protein
VLPRRTTGCVILLDGLGNTAFVGIPMIWAFYGPEWMSLGIVAGFHAWRAAEPARATELLFALGRIMASRLRRHLGAARRDAAAY